ncbi:methyltransferase [Amycolatopsis sp. EV170708-02-1]|uniref:methyltransferase n=1 Tax=Amycolatopsis sp. EV170708-02-1 TaxID=2919322 RepID=UPI001F0BAD72|nr:methyltransferase [Amycolatopsis sp. EV170708-02-1]UMP06453.1 methyltransferase [Amycolatopsis sp. EV170708-02-1]
MTTHDQDRQEFLRLAGLATPMALRVAVTLGLPDRLSGEGATAGDLAADLGQSPLALDLLLGHLTTLGVLERAPDGYRTTEYGAKLRPDAGNGLAGLLDINAAGGRGELAFVELAHSIATGEAGYIRRYGKDFWADLAEHPHLRETFDRQMTQRYLTQVPRFVSGFDWSRFGTLVDVGGGHGSLLAAILKANPLMRGHLVDLAPTAAAAERELREQGLGDRVEVSAGSFFDPLPPGADAYLLSDILHDWDDEHAHRILARCAEAAGTGSRVLVIEAVGGLGAQTEWDLVMLVLYGGRERRLDELRELAAAHGLVFDSVTTLTEQRSLLEFHRGDIP